MFYCLDFGHHGFRRRVQRAAGSRSRRWMGTIGLSQQVDRAHAGDFGNAYFTGPTESTTSSLAFSLTFIYRKSPTEQVTRNFASPLWKPLTGKA
jgi:hypothetical protein